MKFLILPFVFLLACFFSGCTTSGDASASAGSEASATGESSKSGVRTAYEGSTGPKLLMEQYKAGTIEGLRD